MPGIYMRMWSAGWEMSDIVIMPHYNVFWKKVLKTAAVTSYHPGTGEAFNWCKRPLWLHLKCWTYYRGPSVSPRRRTWEILIGRGQLSSRGGTIWGREQRIVVWRGSKLLSSFLVSPSTPPSNSNVTIWAWETSFVQLKC